MICSKLSKELNIELILIGSGTEESLIRLDGFVKDLIGRLEIKEENLNIKIKIT